MPNSYQYAEVLWESCVIYRSPKSGWRRIFFNSVDPPQSMLYCVAFAQKYARAERDADDTGIPDVAWKYIEWLAFSRVTTRIVRVEYEDYGNAVLSTNSSPWQLVATGARLI